MEETLNNIDEKLESALLGLKSLTVENFDSTFNSALNQMKEAHELRRDIDLNELSDNCSEKIKKINNNAKLIQETYDNMVNRYEEEIQFLKNSLKVSLNQKKIAKYVKEV